jgi:uncharacterized protein (DUF4415 family)
MKKHGKPLVDKNGEVRPLRASDKVKASLLRDDFPELAEYSKKRRAGRPKSESPKQNGTLRMAADLWAKIKASGRGYNIRVENVLRQAIMEGRI